MEIGNDKLRLNNNVDKNCSQLRNNSEIAEDKDLALLLKFKNHDLPIINKERLTNNFFKLAGINAVYPNEEPIRLEICRQLDELGIKYEKDDYGNFIATIPATKGYEDSPTVLFAMHLDTICSTSPKAAKKQGDWIHTDGYNILGADDRSGIADTLEAIRTVMENNLEHPEVKLVFTMGEEVGPIGSAHMTPKQISNHTTLGYVVDGDDKEDIYNSVDPGTAIPSEEIFNMLSHKIDITNIIPFCHGINSPVVQLALKSLADGGITAKLKDIKDQSCDANTKALNSENIQSIVIGTGCQDNHKCSESISISDMVQVTQSIEAIIINACDLKVNGKGEVVSRFI
jgi:di/tripeptidase